MLVDKDVLSNLIGLIMEVFYLQTHFNNKVRYKRLQSATKLPSRVTLTLSICSAEERYIASKSVFSRKPILCQQTKDNIGRLISVKKIAAWNYTMNMFTQTNLINLTLLSYLLLGDYLVTKLATCSLVSTAHGKLFLACTRIVNELTMA